MDLTIKAKHIEPANQPSMKIARNVERLRPSYIREILECVNQSNCISLAGGLPSPESFPMDIIKQSMAAISLDESVLQYAVSNGDELLLEVLRDRYRASGDQAVFITSGSQQGIDLCARALVDVGRIVVLERPSYLGALQCFALAGAEQRFVAQLSDGPDLQQLEELFTDNELAFFYAVPDFHNPNGLCWSLSKRRQVAELCRKHGVLLIEDSPYRDLRFAGKDLPTMASLLPEQTVQLRSLSKTLAPGLRLSALIAPSAIAAQILKIKQATDLHSNVLAQRLAAKVLCDPRLPVHMNTVEKLYRLRYQAMASDLQQLRKLGCDFKSVEGGMFIWLELPSCDINQLAAEALQAGVAVVPGSEFYISGDSPSALRLNFSFNTPERNSAGIEILEPLIKRFVTAA